MSGLHEVACPIPIEQLALLLRSPEPRVIAFAEELPPKQRAELAGFCAGRAHMRDLALLVASRCEPAVLERFVGMPGRILYMQAQARKPANDAGGGRGRPPISLARRIS